MKSRAVNFRVVPMVLSAIILLIAGCGRKDWKKLNNQQLKQITVDLALTRALINAQNAQMSDSNRQAIYDDLFARYHCTAKDYDSTVAWNTRHKIEYQEELTKLVADSLRKLEQQLTDRSVKRIEAMQAIKSFDEDSVNYLPDHVLFFRSDREQINLYKTLDLASSPESGVYIRLTARVHGRMPKKPLTLCLMLDYEDGHRQTESILMAKPGIADVHCQVGDSSTLRSISAYLRGPSLPGGIAPRKLKQPAHYLMVDSFAIARYSKLNLPAKPLPNVPQEAVPSDSVQTATPMDSMQQAAAQEVSYQEPESPTR